MSLSEQLLITVITAFVTAILSYFGFWRQAKAELEKEFESRFNERKWNTYMKFCGYIGEGIKIRRQAKFVEGMPEDIKGAKDVSEAMYQELVDTWKEYFKDLIQKSISYSHALLDIENEILMVGSKKVVERFLLWRTVNNKAASKTDDKKYMRVLIDLINAMREDLGKGKEDVDIKFFEDDFHEIMCEKNNRGDQDKQLVT